MRGIMAASYKAAGRGRGATCEATSLASRTGRRAAASNSGALFEDRGKMGEMEGPVAGPSKRRPPGPPTPSKVFLGSTRAGSRAHFRVTRDDSSRVVEGASSCHGAIEFAF